MSDFYTLPGIPSDLLDSEEVGDRDLKTSVSELRRAIDLSGAVKIIDLEHAKVHDGLAYVSDFMVYLSGTTEQNFIFETGAHPVHMKEVEAQPDNAEVVFLFLEDSETTGGTAATFAIDGLTWFSMQPMPLNLERDPFPCGCSVLSNPSVTSFGNKHVFYKFMPGTEGVGQQTSGSAAEENWERILKTNHRYHLWVKRLAGTGTTRVKLKMKYYIVPFVSGI